MLIPSLIPSFPNSSSRSQPLPSSRRKLLWLENSPLPFILYAPNDAVSFTVADTYSDFHHVSGNHPRQLQHSLPFVPTIQSSDSAIPIMAIQVTHFPNQHGFSIGFAVHHVIVDGQSFNLFLKSWAHVCKLIKMDSVFCAMPPELTPSFERPPNVLKNPFDFAPKDRSLNFAQHITPPSNWLMATFELTPTHIQKLKKRVLEEVDQEQQQELHLSTFVVAYAYVLTCLMKAKEGECKEAVHLGFAADARGLLDPPISSNYVGNCVIHPAMFLEASEFREESGFAKIAMKINHLILEMRRTRTLKVTTIADMVQLFTNYSSNTEICSVASSSKFKLYEADFGWGNANKVEMFLLGNNNISLMDTKHGGGGVQVGLLFPTHRQWDIFASLFLQGLN